ncbi:hypothetical protein BXZ70DRAFT_910504 [Cristinia sonorae]|uniref:Uncharacterized protein n=1 Tax=Cristinia sonorae TaxID=1940300 RepID=A0A8K0XKU7_9AGAR|nr:hypothetical protein BXZ70DRAFT_910504 [Cristinia sonorae]
MISGTDYSTLKSSKGQSFVTRLLFTGEKGTERLTLSVILEVENPSNRFFGYAPFKYNLWSEGAQFYEEGEITMLRDHLSATAQLMQLLEIQRMVAHLLNKYLTLTCGQARPWTLRQHEALYKLAQMDMEGGIPDNRRMILETSVFRTIHPLKWSIHTLLLVVRKVIAFYSLQHRPKLAGLIFRLRYYRVIFSNGYSSYLRYMKFIDNTDLMLDEKHNVLGYNIEMEMLEEMEQEEENEEDEEYEDEEDWDYRDYDNT